MAEEKKPDPVTAAPDPDEDDLDDLDDVLDEFSNTKIDDKAPTDSSTAPLPPSSAGKAPEAPPSFIDAAASATASLGPAAAEDDFAKQLQAGMADLLGELDNNPEMQKEFEKLVQELGGQAAGAADAANPLEELAAASGASAGLQGRKVSDATEKGREAGASKAKPDDFQEAIKRTMARMQESGESATAATNAAASEDDILAQMLKEMEKGGFGMPGAGGGGDEDFSKMLMGMMEQLTNKEILYEPMKELHDKFPEWMEKNRSKTSKADLDRYDEQKRLVDEIVARFERKGYTDDNAQDREYIVDRMQKMQAAGSPPADLVGDMSAAQEALGDMDASCPTQ